jgi:hypothetical protein
LFKSKIALRLLTQGLIEVMAKVALALHCKLDVEPVAQMATILLDNEAAQDP